MTGSAAAFWDDPAVVARFVARAPDLRLAALLEAEPDARRLRVLDLGCAGGRNTLLLAEAGADVHAVDASAAMVEATRGRVAAVLGTAAAHARVHIGRMDELDGYDAASFDLIVALGILQQARSMSEWHATVAHCARLLRPGGRLLVSTFAPGTDLSGTGMPAVHGQVDVYEKRPGERMVLHDAARLDALLGEYGFTPLTRTATVRVPHDDGGERVTVNGLYRRGDAM
jgi:SAM-dependent methyltransferase